MSAPRTKRQFAGAASDPAQRQITSFFNNNNTGSSNPSFDASSAYDSRTSPVQTPSTPSLPATVQTNLLSVGMRVRKSVPEGYKTGSYSSKSAFALWDESNNGATTHHPSSPAYSSSSEGRSRANAFSAPRELMPFCGIHSVGGLAVQQQPEHFNTTTTTLSSAAVSPTSGDATPYRRPATASDNTNPYITALEEDDMPGLTSSQESVASSTDSAAALSITTRAQAETRKRSFTEEEDEEAPETPDRLNIWRNAQYDGEISPRSLAPVGWGNGRVMAVPRKGRLQNRNTTRMGPAAGAAGAVANPLSMSMSMSIDSVGAGGAVAAAAAAGFKGHGHGQRQGQENVMILDVDDFDEADFLDRNPSWEVEMSDI
ncbi:hypothetical protein SLS62_008016 [Diatrype stigma]|uniref:Uncharacterized protein n=1 Tax=Diatrype stigma TaxID=117547 RepID=A0AAN9UKL7_9PEZI